MIRFPAGCPTIQVAVDCGLFSLSKFFQFFLSKWRPAWDPPRRVAWFAEDHFVDRGNQRSGLLPALWVPRVPLPKCQQLAKVRARNLPLQQPNGNP